jgi:hypothetical protein
VTPVKPTRKRLRCPDCGGRIVTDGDLYTSETYGFACNDCPASWDKKGDPK